MAIEEIASGSREKQIRKTMFRLLEEKPFNFFLKIPIIIFLLIVIIEPLLHNSAVSEINYEFLDKYPNIFMVIIGLASGVLGIILGLRKRALISLLDIAVIITVVLYSLYSTFLDRYLLYPISSEFKFYQEGLLIPLCSMLVYMCTRLFRKNIELVLDDTQIQLAVDLSLKSITNTKEVGSIDELGYNKLAYELFDAIKSIKSRKAFSIGIDGSWGAGKSSLFDILQEDIIPNYNRTTNNKFKVISFSPWQYPDQNSAIHAFSNSGRKKLTHKPV